MLTAKDIQIIAKVSPNKSYEIIREYKRKHNLTYSEARCPRQMIKERYGLSDEDIDKALNIKNQP